MSDRVKLIIAALISILLNGYTYAATGVVRATYIPNGGFLISPTETTWILFLPPIVFALILKLFGKFSWKWTIAFFILANVFNIFILCVAFYDLHFHPGVNPIIPQSIQNQKS